MRIIIAFLIVMPMYLFSQNNTNHILEFDYSRRIEDFSYFHRIITDSSENHIEYLITDSLIIRKHHYNVPSFLYSYRINEFFHLGIYSEKNYYSRHFGLHQKINFSNYIFNNRISRLQLFVNSSLGFEFFNKRIGYYNNKSSFLLRNYSVGIEASVNIIKHLNITSELKYYSDTYISSRHPLFVQFGISYNWGKKIEAQ